jgi:hypothetical protein
VWDGKALDDPDPGSWPPQKENAMDYLTNSASLSLKNSRPLEKSYDGTILITVACVAIGAVVAVYAAAVSGAIDPNELATMVAFP